MAGRYISIQGLKHKPRLNDIKGYVVATNLERTGHFTSSSELFNRIYETDLWTYRANTIEGYTADCPHRERLGYGEECFATAWGIGMPNYKTGAFYFKNVRDWIDVQESTGWINYTAPQVVGNWGGPMWSSAGINTAWAHYQTYGDLRVLDSIYVSAKKWLRFLKRFLSDGILQPYALREYFIGDWMTPEGAQEKGDTKEALFFNNCVYALNLETVIHVAEALGQTQDAGLYKADLTALRRSIHRQFYNAQTNTYSNGLQVPLAFALWQNIVPDSLYGSVLKQFGYQFTKAQPYLGYGSSGLPVLLHFLIEHREFTETVAAHLSNTNKPGYGYFLEKGETTWPESWNGNTGSKIHTCYTGIASWFMQCLAGIRPGPERPGYQSFILQPTLVANLTYATAQTETLYGTIKSSWQKKGAKLIFTISIPVNTEARFCIPVSQQTQIREGGKPIEQVKEARIIDANGAATTIEVGAGNYEFVTASKKE